jgi:ABC-type antimicrobial peptide transport system permease subunit
MFPLGLEKDYFYDEYDDDGRWALISLDSNVSELKLLVQALKLIVATIVILLVIIISVGISSTYRVIVIKRNVESGTLRALGMKPSGIMRMFVTEGFVLLLSGSIVGFICSLLIVNVAKIFNLSFITGFDLFLTGGCLAPSCNLVKIVLFVSVIIVTTLLSVLFTLRKLVHVSPVGAITSTN